MSEDIGDRGEEQQFQICPSLAGIRSARLGRRPPMMFLSGPPIGPCAVNVDLKTCQIFLLRHRA
jgi:hypothetical protein